MKISKNTQSGSTLVIVVLFMGLLVGLAILFLLSALTAVQLSNSSVSEENSTNLAMGASDTVIGDLRQEIIDGSTKTTYAGSGSQTYNVYQPKPSAGSLGLSTAIPAVVGFTPAITKGIETDGLANLVKISQNGTPFYSSATNPNYNATGANRASAVSTSATSLDGRYISPARWNSHYLIQRQAAYQNSTTLNSTPVSNFPAPDWVIVTRAGAQTPYTTSNLQQLADSTNSKYAIGRYAYAIYNEGGLLDMNAAGFPGKLTPQQIAQKGSLAFADLTQLGLTQSSVDQIVGWRNAYTAQLGSGSQFGSISFTTAASTSWMNNFAIYNNCQTNNTLSSFGLKNGFMSVNPATNLVAGPSNAPSDQMFVSRSQLLSLVESLGDAPDILQYMGTFSRCLEQPSYTPNTARPLVGNWISGGTPPPAAGGPTGANESNYMGNNDAQGGDNQINPSFLSIRVKNTFTRFNGQSALVGEPLVLYRFPLSNLAMVAYNATNASLPTGFIKTSADPDPILDHFGLTRSSAGGPWIYNHGGNKILTLSQVAALNREPDFAELLKASIAVGAMAKGAPNLNWPGNSNYEYTIDTTTDYQVLQIMANLIDQQDADSYPTWIQIASGPGNSSNIYGVEDLPYFYRYHLMAVVDQLPNPLLSSTNIVYASSDGAARTVSGTGYSFPTASAGSAFSKSIPAGQVQTQPPPPAAPVPPRPWAIDHAVLGNSITTPGDVAYMYIADLWNPHDPTTASQNNALRPTKLRVWAQTANPVGQGGWLIGASAQSNGPNGFYPSNILPANDGASPPVNYYQPISPAVALTQATSEIDFSDNNGLLFREPTLLWNNNPTGINLTPVGTSVGPVTDINTNNSYVGIIAGKAPLLFKFTLSSVPPVTTNTSPVTTGPGSADGTYIGQATNVTNSDYITAASGAYQQITFYLQYQDPFGNWITYDTKYPDLHGLTAPTAVVNTADFPNSKYENPFASNQVSDQASVIEPRSARWGVGTQQSKGEVSLTNSGGSSSSVAYLLEGIANANVVSSTSSAYTQIGKSNFSVFETARPRADKANSVNYSNPGMVTNPGLNIEMRLFGGVGFSATNGQNAICPNFFDGLLSQNNPNISIPARSGGAPTWVYFEDADGIARRAMGAYASTALTDTSTSDLPESISSSNNRIGLPEATASSFDNNANPTPTQQAQSRPIVLNRPFRSVSEMSYCFTGTPWKNIDFFTPESAYPALLDTFCVGQPPASGLVGGKVDLNTRQAPVLQAVVAGASRDEWYNLPTPPTYALPPISSIPATPNATSEAGLIAQRLVAYTTDKTNLWRGPLANVSDLVGRYIPNMSSNPAVLSGASSPDWYTYNPPAYSDNIPADDLSNANKLSSKFYTYAGFTGLLDSSVYTASANNTNLVAPIIQRFKEAGLRPLADCGQTRVWNLMIDVIAQSGKYPKSAQSLADFAVDGEKRMWIHVAIDRQTGQILDKQIEIVNQ